MPDRLAELDPALRRELTAEGWTVVRTKSYHLLQERARSAERRLEWESEHNESTRLWAVEAFNEQRRLRDRLDVVFAAAVELGVDAQLIVKANEKDKD
jgi:predicted ABC-class ATPase